MTRYVVSLKRQILIHRTCDVVFKAATDWEQQALWIPATRVTPLLLGGQAVGGTIAAFTGIGRLGFVDTMTIVEWMPPQVCRMHHTGRVVRGDGVFEVVQCDDRTSTFIWSETIVLPFGLVGKIGWIVVRPVLSMMVGFALQRFKQWVERTDAA
jgi:hypothetical protein